MKLVIKNINFFFVILIIFTLNEASAHGPSRQKVNQTIDINASIENVWEIVSSFKNFNWNSDIKNIEVGSNEIGSERVLKFNNGSVVKQKLEKIDDTKKIVSWRIIETDNQKLPVNSYAAKIILKSVDSNITKVTYKAGFYRGFMGNDPPDELNDESSKKKVTEFIKNALIGLKKIVEKN